MFDNFTEKYTNCLSNLLKKEVILPAKFPSVYDYMGKVVTSTCYQSLIYEVNLKQSENKLHGKTARDRYADFESQCGSSEFHAYYESKYPHAHELIELKVKNTAKFVTEIINNFFADQQAINSKFDCNVTEIRDIKLGEGDTHNGGKTIARIYTDDIDLLYKPHSLDTDYIFSNILDYLYEKKAVTSSIKTVPTLAMNNYGWQVRITPQVPTSELLKKHIYWKLGVFQAIFYFLGSSDVHYENVILSGDTPYIIDTETLLSPKRDSLGLIPSKAHTLLNSVIATALLPFSSGTEKIDVDFSGLFGGALKSNTLTKDVLVAEGTDHVKIRKELLDEPSTYPNKVAGDVTLYQWYFSNGFSQIVSFVIDHKQEFKEFLLGLLTDDLRIRQIVRNTLVYGRFLDALNHPEIQCSSEKRTKLLNTLYVDQLSAEFDRIDDEVETMKSGEIPMYFTNPTSRDLLTNDGLIVSDYFSDSPIHAIIERIDNLDADDLKFQKKLIALSYSTKSKNIFGGTHTHSIIPREQNVSNYLSEIYSSLKSSIVYSTQTHGPDLIFMKLLPETQVIRGLSYDIYESTGMLMFLNDYEDSVQVNAEHKMFNQLIKPYLERVKNIPSSIPLSLFNGATSILLFIDYLKQNKLISLDSQSYIDKLYLNFILTHFSFGDDKLDFDFIDGNMGVLYYLTSLESIRVKDFLERIVLKLLKAQVSNHSIGLAHGLSGISLAYASLAQESIYQKPLVEKLIKLLNLEDQLVENESLSVDASWCRGYAGLIIARIRIFELLGENNKYDFKGVISKYSALLIEGISMLKSLGMCHGYFGSLEVLKQVLNVSSDLKEKFEDQYNVLSNNDSIMFVINDKYYRAVKNPQIPLESFMLGSTGVGYELLGLRKTGFSSPLLLKFGGRL